MLYKVVEKFGPESGDAWGKYIDWIGLHHLQRFDSVDSILRPDKFIPETKDDWENCQNDNYKLNFITNLQYAKKILAKSKDAELVGVEIDITRGHTPSDHFLGYDIIDGYCDVSIITNCGFDHYPFDRSIIGENGLIQECDEAIKAKEQLRADPQADSHTEECTVWAIYEVCT